MARIKNPAEGQVETGTEATPTEAQAQAQPEVETSTTETSTESTPTAATGSAAEAKPAEAGETEINLVDFEASIESAVASASTTGEASPEAIKAVQEEYRKLDGNKAKAAARTAIREGMKKAVKDANLERAKVLMTLDEEVKSAPAKAKADREPRKPVDPTEAYLESRVTLHLAYANLVKPDGLAEDVEAQASAKVDSLNPQVQSYITYLQADKDSRGDEPEVDPIVKAAAKLALGKKPKASGSGGSRSTSTYSGPSRNVKNHIASAFADKPSGTWLKVSEIVKHDSAEYGSDHPSPGAVTASLKSAKFDVPGISLESVDGKLGARKA